MSSNLHGGTVGSVGVRHGTVARRRIIGALVACLSVLALCGTGASAAGAAPTAGPGWAFKANFGSGSFLNFFLETPRSPIAVDGDENIFAADQVLETVYVFKPDETNGGEALTQFSTAGGGISPLNLAIDQTDNAVYVDAVGGTSVKRWISDGNTPPTYSLDPTFGVAGGAAIAVDPTSGDLLVADSAAEAVRRYDSTGTLLETISTPSISPAWIVALSDGSFYVAPASGPDLTHFSGTGTLLGTIANVGSLHGLAYDSARDIVAVSIGEKIVTYPAAGGARLAESTAKGGAGIGIGIDGSSRLYEDVTESINAYAPGTVPGVEAPSIPGITSTGFHVSAEVNPGAGPPAGSKVRFEYSVDGQSWISTPDQALTSAGASTVEADISGLQPNTQYQVRAAASNDVITSFSAATKASTQIAPPGTETLAAADVSETGATISGTINPYGLQTTYYFEYGPTTAYGTKVPVGIEAAAGNGRIAKAFSRTLSGLTPGTTYHFRLVATSSGGTSLGADRTFSTQAGASLPARAYEQVTPVDKLGAIIAPSINFRAAANGDAITYSTKSGPRSAPIFSRYAAIRGAEDWRGDIGTDAPIATTQFAFITRSTLAVSSDFSHALVASNRALAPGGIEQGGNLYLLDLATGKFEFIGGSAEENFFAQGLVGTSSGGMFHAGAPDFSWVVFHSRAPLLPGAPRAAMYRWSEADGLELVSVLPNGQPTSVVHQGSYQMLDSVSADGTRIYYAAIGGSETGVFLRERGGPPTPISVSHVPGDPTTPQPAVFFGTNESGRYAFIVAGKLTTDAPEESKDLYRYDASTGNLEYLGTGAFYGLGESSNGFLLGPASFGIGADGRTIYFNQSSGGNNGNFSVWHDGVVHNIMSSPLATGDERASPNGRYFVFYESVGSTAQVIERYDAETEEISCVSCLPDGTPVSAALPPPNLADIGINNTGQLAVDDSGTVYFDTEAQMVAADVNGARDVYTWNDGALTLISPGNGPFDASYADASTDGSDIFFTTTQGLVGRDTDRSVDVYDARVGGGLPRQNVVPPEECLRACKAAPEAPVEPPVVGSEALNGPGNVKPGKKQLNCGKGKRKVKVNGKAKCVKKHKAGKNKKGGNR